MAGACASLSEALRSTYEHCYCGQCCSGPAATPGPVFSVLSSAPTPLALSKVDSGGGAVVVSGCAAVRCCAARRGRLEALAPSGAGLHMPAPQHPSHCAAAAAAAAAAGWALCDPALALTPDPSPTVSQRQRRGEGADDSSQPCSSSDPGRRIVQLVPDSRLGGGLSDGCAAATARAPPTAEISEAQGFVSVRHIHQIACIQATWWLWYCLTCAAPAYSHVPCNPASAWWNRGTGILPVAYQQCSPHMHASLLLTLLSVQRQRGRHLLPQPGVHPQAPAAGCRLPAHVVCQGAQCALDGWLPDCGTHCLISLISNCCWEASFALLCIERAWSETVHSCVYELVMRGVLAAG